jgi:hypothetical protein
MLFRNHGIFDSKRQAVAGGPSYPTSGLLCHLPLESDLSDDSGNGYNATAKDSTELAAMSYTTGKIGNALVLPNRSGTGFKLGMSGPSAFTISHWVKTSQSGRTVLGNNDSAAIPAGWWLLILDTTLHFEIYNGSWGNSGNTGTINDNNWHMVTYTFDGTNAWQIIVDNGTPVTLTKSANVASPANPIYIGSYQPFNGQQVVGNYDSFFCYNRVLTSTEIGQLWNSGSGV